MKTNYVRRTDIFWPPSCYIFYTSPVQRGYMHRTRRKNITRFTMRQMRILRVRHAAAVPLIIIIIFAATTEVVYNTYIYIIIIISQRCETTTYSITGWGCGNKVTAACGIIIGRAIFFYRSAPSILSMGNFYFYSFRPVQIP